MSRRFVVATEDRLATLMERRLDDERWLVVYLDGFSFGEHLLVGALGITEDGTKVPLAVAKGTTENKIVCTRLVAGLAERGLDEACEVLFCVNGSKAFFAAIRSVFGNFARIQRCRRHVTDTLLATLESTNPMESMIEIVRDHSRRVKRWRDGEMALRWAAAAMACAQTQFRRVRGHKQLPDLAAALFEATADARRAVGIDIEANVAVPACA